MSEQSSCGSSGVLSNDEIRTQIVRMYADFVSEVDPKGGVMDWLVQEEVVTFEQKDRIVAETTRQARCRKLLDELFASSNPRAFVVLRQSLINEKKSWIVDRIDTADLTQSTAVMDDAKTTYQLETELDAAKKEIEALKDEVQKLQKRDPSKIVSRKLVIVGDGATGKSSILNVLQCGKFPEIYVPTVNEVSTVTLILDNIQCLLVVWYGMEHVIGSAVIMSCAFYEVNVHLWDTAGQEDYDRLRPLSYPETDVFVICFSVISRETLENAQAKWYPEVRQFPAPILVVGNQIDLRRTADNKKQVSTEEGQRVADEIKAGKYCECSAKTGVGVSEMFEAAVRLTLYNKHGKLRKNNKERSEKKSRKTRCTLQ